MKTQKNAVTNVPQVLTDYLAKHVTGENGSITLDAILKSVPIDRQEAFHLLKQQKGFTTIIGRRNSPTRIAWGNAVQSAPMKSANQKSKGLGFLRVKAGKFIQEIPIDSMDLITA